MNQLLTLARSKTIFALTLYLLVIASLSTFVYIEVQALQLVGNPVPLGFPADLQ